ncbi:uncharacterized protein [Manis javanica]|uniref:uncharacterized protein isoform X1 n=1 Tax=Manis javanica TaxID=9974 RepID=UPI003C6D7B37
MSTLYPSLEDLKVDQAIQHTDALNASLREPLAPSVPGSWSQLTSIPHPSPGPGQSHTQDARPAGPGHGCLPAFSFIPKPGRIGKLYGSFPLQPRSPAEPASDSRRLPDSGLGPLAGHGGGAGVWEQPVSAACGDPPVQG